MSLRDRDSIDEKVHRGVAITSDPQPRQYLRIIRGLINKSPFRRNRGNEYMRLHDDTSPQRNQHTQDDLPSPDSGRRGSCLRSVGPLGTLAGLYAIANLLYFLSLRGAKSPKQMNSLLGFLGVCLVGSVLFLTAQFWASMTFLNVSPRWRRLNALILIVTIIIWYLLDNGNNLGSHGAFNLLIFCVILIPSNALIGLLYVWYTWTSTVKEKRLRRFLSQLLGATLAVSIILLLVAKSKEDALAYGFLGRQISCSAKEKTMGTCHLCQWKSAIPWFDLLPVRLNIFTGPMTCPLEDSLQASFTDDGKLSIKCDKIVTEAKSWFNGSVLLRHNGAIYTKLPRTETWGLPLKGDSLETKLSPLQQEVLRLAERDLKRYEGPVLIDDNTDTILAFCGPATPKLLNRIIPAAGIESEHRKTGLSGQKLGQYKLNVVTLFVDAVSRRHLHRRLPETSRMLERTVSAPNATSELFEFFRYHTVGLNTGPNTRALWTGLDENDSVVPGIPLWEQYQSAGYVSARIDPMCQDWTAYYNAAHFESSSDAYISHPRISHEYLTWSCFPPYLPIGGHNSGNFAGPTSIQARCLSGTHVGWHELDWASNFITTYRKKRPNPFYLNAAFMEGHEGSGEVLRTLDTRLERFLNPDTSPIDFNSTAILILSDHGALMGLNNAFFQNGKTEAANPAAVMILPTWLTGGTRRGTNLREATQGLVTAHDLYETMKEFISINTSSLDEDTKNWPLQNEPRRGVNLFRQSLPDRNCKEAGIAESACRCI